MRNLIARFATLLFVALFSITLHASDHDTGTPDSKSATKDALRNKKSSDTDDVDTKLKNKSASRSAAAQREKDDKAADELAEKIALKVAEIRKENEKLKPPAPIYRATRRPSSYSLPQNKTTISAMSSGARMPGELLSQSVHQIHWSYEGEGGPANWAKIDPANAKCDIGMRQSPIDIRDGIHVDLEPIQFDYKPTRFNVVDNGHSIQVNLAAGNSITLSGVRYDLVQFHFHKPSEERVNGRVYEMVAHLVHKSSEGKLAVIAVLLEPGKSNELIQTIWNDLPLEKNEPAQPTGTIDINQLLPTSKLYFTYMGSLTTPPCTEGVLWMVFKQALEITQEQINIFSRLYPRNARPIQNTFDRLIKESN